MSETPKQIPELSTILIEGQEPSIQSNASFPIENDILYTRQNAIAETDGELGRESFIKRRWGDIKNFYENLTPKQKDVLQIGAMALSTTLLPSIGIMEGGAHAQGAEMFLEAEGLAGFAALELAAGVKAVRVFRNR